MSGNLNTGGSAIQSMNPFFNGMVLRAINSTATLTTAKSIDHIYGLLEAIITPEQFYSAVGFLKGRGYIELRESSLTAWARITAAGIQILAGATTDDDVSI